jgi:hypothetical protein
MFGQKGIGKIQIVSCGLCITDNTNCRCVYVDDGNDLRSEFCSFTLRTSGVISKSGKTMGSQTRIARCAAVALVLGVVMNVASHLPNYENHFTDALT